MFEITEKKMIEIVHDCMADVVKQGDAVCDCTMGNGFDTLKLCELVGSKGRVYAFDVQQEAIEHTELLLKEHSIDMDVRLICDSHSCLNQYIKEQISFFVFNLGYLPKGNPDIMTHADTTIEALMQVLELTKKGCGGAVLSYYGHQEGEAEKNAVEQYLQALPAKYYQVMTVHTFNRKNSPPVLYLIKKLK